MNGMLIPRDPLVAGSRHRGGSNASAAATMRKLDNLLFFAIATCLFCVFAAHAQSISPGLDVSEKEAGGRARQAVSNEASIRISAFSNELTNRVGAGSSFEEVITQPAGSRRRDRDRLAMQDVDREGVQVDATNGYRASARESAYPPITNPGSPRIQDPRRMIVRRRGPSLPPQTSPSSTVKANQSSNRALDPGGWSKWSTWMGWNSQASRSPLLIRGASQAGSPKVDPAK